MTCRAAAGFISHDLTFAEPTPMGFALCRRCGGYFTKEQWAAWRCEGALITAAFVPRTPGSVRCALCSEPVLVDPRHRQHVASFGATCTACFSGVVA